MSLFYRALELINRPAAQEEEGQAMVEYGLLVALIAIIAMAGVALVGPRLLTLFTNIANALVS